MKAADGKTYDRDFFLTGELGKMTVTETAVHKIDRKALYDWTEGKLALLLAKAAKAINVLVNFKIVPINPTE